MGSFSKFSFDLANDLGNSESRVLSKGLADGQVADSDYPLTGRSGKIAKPQELQGETRQGWQKGLHLG